MEFTLLVTEYEGQTFVWTSLPDEAKAAVGEGLEEHTFTLKSPLQERHRQEADRLMWHSGNYDGSLQWAATAVAYLQSWSLPQPLTLDGFAQLHPALAGTISAQILNRVFPGQHPFLASLLNDRQPTSPEPV